MNSKGKNKGLNLAYGIYIENSHRYIYDCILSILTISKYNDINSITIFTNNYVSVTSIMSEYFNSDLLSKLTVLQDTSLVDSIFDLCGELGAHRYLTRGVFYRLQALTCCKDFMYLDTDVICYGKIKKPKYIKNKDIIKNKNDSSCIMYSYDGLDLKDLLYYIKYHKDHINTLEFPDECIIHDGFGFHERCHDFKNLIHFGNTEYSVHNEFNFELWRSLLYYINNVKDINPLLFECYFREPRTSFLMEKTTN